MEKTIMARQLDDAGIAEALAMAERYRLAEQAPAMLRALQLAESFISGFEGDELQEGVAELLQGMRQVIAAALGNPTVVDVPPIPAAPANGPYSPELAEAFRQGAREVAAEMYGDRIHIDANARVEECEPGDGGAIVHCTIFVSDGEREALPGEEEDESEESSQFLNHYECPCGETWQDEWSATCDDDCPACGTTCSPHESEEV